MNRLRIAGLLGLLSAVACDESSVPLAPPPQTAFTDDAGEFCTARPLADHCDVTDCPNSLDELRQQVCQARGGEAQANTCGGQSVTVVVGLGSTIWHFDRDGELIGARVFEDTAVACTENGFDFRGDRQFGVACQPTGGLVALCPAVCPAVACVSGARLEADLPYGFGEVPDLRFTACRNAECYGGSLPGDARIPAGGSAGFELPSAQERDALMGGLARVNFARDFDGTLVVSLEWLPWADTDLVEGDRYRLLVREAQGEQDYVLIDRRVSYDKRSVGSGGCLEVCHYAEEDLRATGDLDAGSAE